MDMDRALIKKDEKNIVIKMFKACIKVPLSFNKKGKKHHNSGLRSKKAPSLRKVQHSLFQNLI